MTAKELQKYFKDHLVPSRLYNMKGGHHKNRICLGWDKTRQEWEVYYSEGRAKIGLMQFDNESEACQRMKEEVSTVMELIYGLKIVS